MNSINGSLINNKFDIAIPAMKKIYKLEAVMMIYVMVVMLTRISENLLNIYRCKLKF